jgi:hypothetical protein
MSTRLTGSTSATMPSVGASPAAQVQAFGGGHRDYARVREHVQQGVLGEGVRVEFGEAEPGADEQALPWLAVVDESAQQDHATHGFRLPAGDPRAGRRDDGAGGDAETA